MACWSGDRAERGEEEETELVIRGVENSQGLAEDDGWTGAAGSALPNAQEEEVVGAEFRGESACLLPRAAE